ncbi:MAG: GAF domain-containing protein [Chloroflexi bacterium]|nr:GAF domain-containing protein [Chloroflexota bacterium]
MNARARQTGGTARGQRPSNGDVAGGERADLALLHAADLLTCTEDCAFALQADGRFVGWNAAAEKLFGYRWAEIAGRSCHDVLACRDLLDQHARASDCPLLRAVRATGPGPAVDLLARHRSGHAVEVSGSIVQLPPAYDARVLVLVRPAAFDIDRLLPSDPLDQIDLAGCLDRLLIATGADAAELFLVAPGGRQLLLAAHSGRSPRAFREILRFERGEGFPGLVAATGESLVSADIGHDDRYLRTGVKRRGFHTCVCVPLRDHGQVLGSLDVTFRHRTHATGSVLVLLARVATQLAAALELDRLRIAEAMMRQARVRGPDAAESLRQVVDQALRTLMETTGVERGALLLADDSATRLQVASEQAVPPALQHLLARGQRADTCPALARQSNMLPSDRVSGESPCCKMVRRHLPAALCLPLRSEERPLGVALLGCPGSEPLPTSRLAFLHVALDRAAQLIGDARVALREERAAQVRTADDPHPATPPLTPVDDDGRAPGMPFLDLRILGPLTIRRDGLPVPPEQFARRRALTLLKILLIRYGKPVHREELMELLWPDGDPRSSNDLLHVAVHYLRRGLEPTPPAGRPSTFVLNNGDYYTFDTASPHRLDSHEFLTALRLSEHHERQGHAAEALEACRRAIQTYTGDVLEDEPYSDWCALEREYLRESLLGLLRRVARLEGARGDFEAAAAAYRRALHVDPTLEEIHRELMEILRRAGRHGEALRQYQECRAALRRELGVAPMPATEALRQQIVGEQRVGLRSDTPVEPA